MAEALLRRRLENEGYADWIVESVGTWTDEGRPASLFAVQLMAANGFDLSSHRSQRISRARMEAADLILVMTQNHAEALCTEFPAYANKVFLVSEMENGRRVDVDDPYGGTPEDYRVCFDTLSRMLDAGFDGIISLASGNALARTSTVEE
jgi:protein-tyrosine-phosphatase